MLFFKNMFGRESIEQLTDEALHKARVELFNVRLSKEAIEEQENKLLKRIRRLELDQQRSKTDLDNSPPALKAV